MATQAGARNGEGVGPPLVPSRMTLVDRPAAIPAAGEKVAAAAPATKARRLIRRSCKPIREPSHRKRRQSISAWRPRRSFCETKVDCEGNHPAMFDLAHDGDIARLI